MKTAKRPWRKLQDLFVYEDRIGRKPRKVARPDGKPPCAQAKLQQWEVLRGSKFLCVDTAGSKAASRLGFDGRRNFSFQKNSLSLHINVRNGNGRKQCLGIGMGRMLEKLFTRAEFHDFTQIHYHDIGGNVLDHQQIVGNEQISQGSLLLEILHQIQDLGLYRYI